MSFVLQASPLPNALKASTSDRPSMQLRISSFLRQQPSDLRASPKLLSRSLTKPMGILEQRRVVTRRRHPLSANDFANARRSALRKELSLTLSCFNEIQGATPLLGTFFIVAINANVPDRRQLSLISKVSSSGNVDSIFTTAGEIQLSLNPQLDNDNDDSFEKLPSVMHFPSVSMALADTGFPDNITSRSSVLSANALMI